MDALDLVQLSQLMEITADYGGVDRRAVAIDHPDLAGNTRGAGKGPKRLRAGRPAQPACTGRSSRAYCVQSAVQSHRPYAQSAPF
jgi:hypothetical protein